MSFDIAVELCFNRRFTIYRATASRDAVDDVGKGDSEFSTGDQSLTTHSDLFDSRYTHIYSE